MNNQPEHLANGYNKQAGWFYEIKSKQNAKGQLSFEIKISGADDFAIVEKTYKLLSDLETVGKEKGFTMSHQPKGEQITD